MLKYYKNLLELYAEEIASDKIKLSEIPSNVFLTQPGDIISFVYRDKLNRESKRLCLVVSTRKTYNGRRVSSLGSKLIYTFDLTDLDQFDLGVTIEVCFQKRRRCSYKNVPKGLQSFLGKDNFRTFNIARMMDLNRLGISR
jgi:hypothetical protein